MLQSTYVLRDARWAAGATDAARGAADIVLTRPGLSVIVSAIIGARKIFQRMTTYSKYTVAMTFRVCFTFGLLTVIYNWCAPSCSSHGRLKCGQATALSGYLLSPISWQGASQLHCRYVDVNQRIMSRFLTLPCSM